ncbi:hypothetical protein FACS189483_06950 [Spirochaetia bacterium]|nr:hypothetical protein FACS189483_06950 [Spirochaetia bacterium]
MIRSMKIVTVKNIERKDVPIYYRRLFSGTVVLELVNKQIERPIDFTIETKPTGLKEITVSLAEPVDYPLIPLMKELKAYLNNLDESGGLPG